MMNTRLKPVTNVRELSITDFLNLLSCRFNSSTPAPEIRETYPGTKGSTHGDRNEIRPATKAAIGKGNDDIAGLPHCLIHSRASTLIKSLTPSLPVTRKSNGPPSRSIRTSRSKNGQQRRS